MEILMTIFGTIVFLIPVIGILWLLNHFNWFKKLKGDTPRYKDIWKPISVVATISFIRAVPNTKDRWLFILGGFTLAILAGLFFSRKPQRQRPAPRSNRSIRIFAPIFGNTHQQEPDAIDTPQKLFLPLCYT